MRSNLDKKQLLAENSYFAVVFLIFSGFMGRYSYQVQYARKEQKMSENILQKRPHLIPALITAIMLFAALSRWPYGYYQLLRFVTCVVGAYIAYKAYQWQKIWAVWLFGFIAILFNPFLKIHFDRDVWQFLDAITAVVFIAGIFIIKPLKE